MDGVSLRFPRPVIVTAAIGVAAAWAALGSVPALADQVRQDEWWLGALHITQAQQTTEGANVTIALLDTGVDPAQPDIAGSVITGPDYTGSGETPGSRFYGVHGTAMASLIVGHGHGPGGADGTLGVAPAAKLLSVRVSLDGDDPLLADSGIVGNLPGAIAQGIRYAVSNGAQVIDLPLDPGQSPSALIASTAPAPPPDRLPTPTELAERAAAGGSAAEQSAVAFALSRGVVLVAPAGDNGTGTDEPNFPADYPGVISVGAFNSGFIKAPFSSHRPYVTLTAAGSGMTAAIPTGYATVSSTSAASAVVTGIVALIKSEYPALTPAQVTQALTNSTVFRPPNGLTDGSGHGTADAAAALAAAQKIAGPVPRAGAGAVAATQPTAPPVPVIDQALAPKIKRDGLISGALLAVLLVLIVFYTLVRRRRRKARQVVLAGPAASVRIPYGAHSGDSSTGPMMQYFTAVPAEPGSAREPGVPVGTGQPAVVRGPSAARGNGNFGGAFGEPPAPGAPGPQGDDAHRAGQFARSPIAPLRRALARPPKVSGTPPWEPAPKPDTELPWASSAPLPRRTPVPTPAAPASGAPADSGAGAAAAADGGAAGRADAAGAGGWAAGGWAAGSWAAGNADGGAVGGEPAGDADGGAVGDAIWGSAERPRVPAAESGAADSDGATRPGIRPIYVWNPSASTETFPSVPSTRRPDSEAPEPPSED
jgi:subtilisin family serine protease